MKVESSSKILLSIAITFLFLMGVVFSVSRDLDEIEILTPLENSSLIGVADVEWKIIDADQIKIPVQIDVFNLSCANNGDFFGTVTDNTDSFTKLTTNTYAYLWNTMDELQTVASIPDGDYCLRVCGTFLRDKNYYYSLCDTRTVSIENDNRKPQILSAPSDLNYSVGDEFAYQINAYDADGDTLTFSKISGPTFILVNSSTGLVKSQTELGEPGSFTIKIRVTDTKGAYAEQIFTINVQQGSGVNYELSVTNPKEKDVIKAESYTIRWSIDSTSGIKEFNVYYSKDGESWEKLGKVDSTKTTYTWDLENIKSGYYYVKVEAVLLTGNTVNAVSGQFSIDKSGGNIPLIRNVQPVEDSTISNTRPEVKASFGLDEDAVINDEQTLVSLDDNNITDCTYTDNTITCTPDSDLSKGKHKVKVVVVDSFSKTNTKEWFFTIGDEGSNGGSDNTTGGSFDAETLQKILLYACCGLLLIIIPFLAYLVVKRFLKRRREKEAVGPMDMPNLSGVYVQPQVGYTDVGQPQQQTQTTNNQLTYDTLQPQETAATLQPIDQSIQMPSSYTSDEIPDWLKGSDVDKPISITGEDFTGYQQSDQAGGNEDIARPHE